MKTRRIILTIDEHKFLIPVEQSKDLTTLLANLGDWRRVKSKSYSNKEMTLGEEGGYPPTLEVAVIDESNIEGLTPSAVKAAIGEVVDDTVKEVPF